MWRWRPSPLRRRSDLVEAWAGLAAVALAAVGAPAAGIAAGRAVDTTLRQTAAAQRAHRYEVRAVVSDARTPRPRAAGSLPTDPSAARITSHPSRITWTGRDGRAHQAAITVLGRHPAGTVIPMWIDARHEKPTDPPMDTATATSNAIAAGVGAAAGLVALVMAARHLLGWRILRRRLAAWERDWSRVSGDWAGAEG